MKMDLDDAIFEELEGLLGNEPIEDRPPDEELTWAPDLTECQQRIFDSTAKFGLAWGDRGGGKTFGIGHKIVRHCYENQNAFALIIVGVRSQATLGGIWEKLDLEILPEWHDQLGIKYTEPKMDEMRYRFRMVQNAWGGWSKILLVSFPYADILKKRIKGFEPSFIFVDEGTTLESPIYFSAVTQQLGRRPGVSLQQYWMATNPAGPSHWVYKRFFQIPLEESKHKKGPKKGQIISPEGEWDDRYEVIEMTSDDNRWLNEDYYETVTEAVRDDEIEEQRMLEGKWIDRPSGDSIFASEFHPEIHIRGDAKKRILPSKNFPITIGYDVGPANKAIVFMQSIPTEDYGLVWVVFDEMVYVNRTMRTETVVREEMRRMAFWNRKREMKYDHLHISDDSAFNKFHENTGSYDVLDYETHSRKIAKSFDDLNAIKMKPAPKFKGSVEARVRLLKDLLVSERLLVSSSCKKTKEMLLNLKSEKVKEGVYDASAGFKPKRSVHLHVFDALTYPIIWHQTGGVRVTGVTDHKTEILDIGVGS